MRLKYSYLTLLVLLQFYQLTYMNNAWALSNPPKLTKLSVAEGLSQNTISSMALDNSGYLWVATAGGLNRFDGYRVEAVTPPSSQKSNYNQIISVFQDSSKHIWISDAAKGLYRLSSTSGAYDLVLPNDPTSQKTDINVVWHMYEQENGDLWLASHQNLRLLEKGSNKTRVVYTLEDSKNGPSPFIRRLALHDNFLFMATTVGVFVLDTVSRKVKQLRYVSVDYDGSDKTYTRALAVQDDTLWIGTKEGLYSVELSQLNHFMEESIDSLVTELRVDEYDIRRILPEEDRLLLATGSGLFDYNPKQSEVSRLLRFTDDPRLEASDNAITEIVKDTEGNYWLGSELNGAFHWNQITSSFQTIYKRQESENQISNNLVWSVLQTDKNTLWIGTNNGLNKVNLQNASVANYLVSNDIKAFKSPGTIYKLMKSQNNIIWLHTGDDDQPIKAFDTSTEKLRSPLMADESTKSIMRQASRGHYIDDDGIMWFIGESGFYQYDTALGTAHEVNALNKALSNNSESLFFGSFPGKEHQLLLSSYGSLWSFNKLTQEVKLIYKTQDLFPGSPAFVDSWVVDTNNTLWLIIPGIGVTGIDTNDYKLKHRFIMGKDLPNKSFYSVQIDEVDDLWIASESGLLRLNSSSGHVTHFTTEDGLKTNEFNGGLSMTPYTKLADGRLAYASIAGVILFHPQDLRSASKTTSPIFTKISLLSRELDYPLNNLSGSTVNLAHDDIGLELNFSNMRFSGQSKSFYRYTLEGTKQINFPKSIEPKILIPQLSPGKYVFSVTTINPFTGEESLPNSINIEVAYAPWASPIAYFLYFFTFLGLFYIWWLNNHRHQERIHDAYKRVMASQAEARIFGEAFQQTHDLVVILDHRRIIKTTNNAFKEFFGNYTSSMSVASVGKLIGLSREKRAFYANVLDNLKIGDNWKGEEHVTNNAGISFPILMSVSAISGEMGHTQYIVALTNITQQKEAEDKLRKLANYDVLTGLPNRSLLLDRIAHAIEKGKRRQSKLALFFIDLDRFKQVNDSLGHDMGDLLLIDVAAKLKNVLRDEDTVARLGGDEFVILLESYESIEDVSQIAKRIVKDIDQPIKLNNHYVSVSSSIGISLYPEDARNHNELFKNADIAMYHAKDAGKNTYQYFTQKINEKAQQKLQKENQLKIALNNDEFVNFYQPILDTNSQVIVGFELLLRWQKKSMLVPPGEFIPLAEEIGLIVRMTQKAMNRGLADLLIWHNINPDIYISINLSTKDLESTTLIPYIEELICNYNLPTSMVRFEITESALMTDVKKAIQTVVKLKSLGVSIALDDFGTGYSSLQYLNEFPVDVIKIDKSFVQDIGIENSGERIVETILTMAKNMGMSCIAEGVENIEQYNYLHDKKCKQLQGYLFSKPLPAEQAINLLTRSQNKHSAA